MTDNEFLDGVGILETAFRKKYSEDFTTLIWRDFRELDGEVFVAACDYLKNQGVKLPLISELRLAYNTIADERKREKDRQTLSAPPPFRTEAEKAETAKLLHETLEKLRAKSAEAR